MHDDSSSKQCFKCGEVKPLAEFNRQRALKDGLCSRCRECDKARRREWYAKPESKEWMRAANAKRYAENHDEINARKQRYYRENRERILESVHRYYRQNAERILKQKRQYREANREWINEKLRQYFRDHPEIRNHHQRLRYARKKGAGGNYTLDDIRRKYEEQGGCCYWCRGPLNGTFEIDHIVPIARGGSSNSGNICCSCKPCNRRKHAKMPWEFSDRLF